MRFRIGAALFGLGVLLLVFAVGLAFYVAPRVTKLPYDLAASTSVAEAPNARFMQIKRVGDEVSIEIREGTLVSTIEVVPQAQGTNTKLPAELRDDAVAWEVYQTVNWKERQELINAYATGLALDRVSGEAVDWDEQWLDDSDQKFDPRADKERPSAVDVDYAGQTYKFPFGTEQKTYRYFDRDLRQALPIEFKGVETILGTEVYRFEQVIDKQPQQVPADRVQPLLNRFAAGATSGRIEYSNTRTLWVEPNTGQYLKVREQQHKELVPNTGNPTVLLDATFTYTDQTVEEAAERADENGSRLALVGRQGPIGLGVLGLLAVIGGLVLVIRGNGGGGGAHRAGDDVPRTGDGAGQQGDGAVTEQESYPDGPMTDTVPAASDRWRRETTPSRRPDDDESGRADPRN
ncbi:DUF3068 domain-containing protein [Plantactinospora endophytica]|uniref:DUF3068 domain-containing protein n=1 Tax=Plantactinospora endophytica TaxID=673535 RepID=A0ABQ4E1F1_9ACTN|nr:DUF3068 domain-containing protein [Plantactinospora endophytica]GIG88554.1 hypothetical protein Pen02_34900 [Plantactinospora endophytica]